MPLLFDPPYLPRFPFTFQKNYSIATRRGTIFTATRGKPGMVNVTWTGNGLHDVTFVYADCEVNTYLSNADGHMRDNWGDRIPSWELLTEAPLVEQPKPSMSFDGNTFVQQRDGVRLTAQYLRVFKLMQDSQWRSLKDISSTTGDPEASVSARLRDLRKEKFGSHTVERRHVDKGLYEYRLAA